MGPYKSNFSKLTLKLLKNVNKLFKKNKIKLPCKTSQISTNNKRKLLSNFHGKRIKEK